MIQDQLEVQEENRIQRKNTLKSNNSGDNYFDNQSETKEAESTQNSFCDTEQRKDAYGNVIKKGSKKFRVSFRDEVVEMTADQKNLVRVVRIRSYKKFNKLFLNVVGKDDSSSDDNNEEKYNDEEFISHTSSEDEETYENKAEDECFSCGFF